MAGLLNFGAFPAIGGEALSAEKLENHLYLLEEQLTYLLTHLTKENFSEEGWRGLKAELSAETELRAESDGSGASLSFGGKGLTVACRGSEGETTLKQRSGFCSLALRSEKSEAAATWDENGLDLRGAAVTIRGGEGEIRAESGVLTAAELNGATIEGQTVYGEEVIAGYLTVGADGDVLESGGGDLSIARNGFRKAALTLLENGEFAVTASDGTVLRLYGDGGVSLSAPAGKTVTIGGAGVSVALVGSVTVNGAPLN